MGDARSLDDRLPWLDAPRPPAKPLPAARRARTPLLVLLGLFFFSAIAVMAYLAGRSLPPVATPAPTTPIPVPTPPPVAPIAPPAPLVTTPAPPVAAPDRAEPAKPRATRPKAARKASIRRSTARRSTPRPVVVHRVRTSPNAYVAPRRPITWAARPFAGPRGRVIQLGSYRTQYHADAAWWRVARAYPYLATLPRVVIAIGPTPGRARYYQVRLAAGSRREARTLCKYLHRIGRGCIIV